MGEEAPPRTILDRVDRQPPVRRAHPDTRGGSRRGLDRHRLAVALHEHQFGVAVQADPREGADGRRLGRDPLSAATLSGAMSAIYPEEAKTDRLIMIWSLMNQWEAMGFRLLWTLLVVLSVFLLAYSFRKKGS